MEYILSVTKTCMEVNARSPFYIGSMHQNLRTSFIYSRINHLIAGGTPIIVGKNIEDLSMQNMLHHLRKKSTVTSTSLNVSLSGHERQRKTLAYCHFVHTL